MVSFVLVLVWFVILGIVVTVYIAQPLFKSMGTFTNIDPAEARMQTLALEREQSYSALADLDEDYETGKLSEADYKELRTALLQETARIVSQLEADAKTDVEAEIKKFKQQKNR